MSDVMLFGVLKMPYEMAMASELSRLQFYQRVQQLVARVETHPEQEPVAVHQFRLMYSADWYDGHPDPENGHGPYETRTLYTAPPQRTWVDVPDEEIKILWIQYRAALPRYLCFAKALLARAKEKNA